MGIETLDHGLDSNEQSNQARNDLKLESLSSEPEYPWFPPSPEIGRWLQAAAMFSILTGPITDFDQLPIPFHHYQPAGIRDLSSSGAVVPRVISFRIEEESAEFIPRTALTRRLWELRQKIVASGRPLLDWDDLESELSDRRGERNSGEES